MALDGATPMVAKAGRVSPQDSLVERSHPDDHTGLLDWETYGPRDPQITRLVHKLAYGEGIGLVEIETVIREALSRRLALERNLASLRQEWAALIEHDDGTPAFFEALCRRSEPFIAGRWFHVRMEPDSAFCPAIDPEQHGLRGEIARSWLSYRDRWEAFVAVNPRVELAWIMKWVSETHDFSSWPTAWEDRLREWVRSEMPDPPPFDDRLEIDTPEWRAKFTKAAINAGLGWVYQSNDGVFEWRWDPDSLQPNAETLAAFDEIERGDQKRFESIEALFEDLKADD